MADAKENLESEVETEQAEVETPPADEVEEQADKNEKKESEAEKKEASAEDEALSVQLMRLQADFTNFRRRSEKEKADIYRLANEKLLTEMLPVLDNMERAMSHRGDQGKEKFAEGVEMVFNSLLQVLNNAGLAEIEAYQLPFDHNLHHAVITEATDGVESNTVTQVLQKGYTLNQKVIRPAMVKVSE